MPPLLPLPSLGISPGLDGFNGLFDSRFDVEPGGILIAPLGHWFAVVRQATQFVQGCVAPVDGAKNDGNDARFALIVAFHG